MTESVSNIVIRTNMNFTGATVTNTGTLTFPTTTTTIVGRDTTDALSNKTITSSTMNSSTNTVGANNLYNGSTWTAAISGPTPTTGQVLTCTGAGVLQFATASNSPVTGTGTTTDGTTLVTLATIPIPAGTSYLITDLVGKRTDQVVTGYAYSQTYKASFENISGTVTQAGGAGQYISQVMADTNVAGLSTTYTISGTNVLVQITGLAATTLQWDSFTTVRSV